MDKKDGELNSGGMKIARPRDGRHKNKLLNGRTGGELNGWHKNNWPKGWMKGELINGRTVTWSARNQLAKGWKIK